MDNLFAVLILISPILWFLSIYLTMDWKHFRKLFLLNFLLFLLYMVTINFTNLIDIGHDEYGLGIIALNLMMILGHITLGLVTSLYIRSKYKNDYS